MTPLIDVMLVLLVIFMITAPLMTIEPEARPAQEPTGATPTDAPQFIALAIDAAGRSCFFGDEARADDALRAARARRPPSATRSTEVQLRADQSVPYGRVAELIGLVQKAGLTRIGFVTERSRAGR